VMPASSVVAMGLVAFGLRQRREFEG